MNPKVVQPASNSTPPPVPPTPVKNSKKKKQIIIAALIVLLLAGLIGAWFIVRKPAPKAQVVVTKPKKAAPAKILAPYALAFSKGDSAKAPTQLFLQPLNGTTISSSGSLAQDNFINGSSVNKNKAFVITTPSEKSNTGETMWYSSDSGKTYTMIYEGTKPDKDRNHSQITSAKFSTDGNTIVIAQLANSGNTNTIKEINPTTKAVKDLFSVESGGVFILGYDRATKQLIYNTGCWGCDGGPNNEIFDRNLATNLDTTIYKDDNKIVGMIRINHDFTKLILVEASLPIDLGSEYPHSILEVTIKDKAIRPVVTIPKGVDTSAGYTDFDDSPYYTRAQDIIFATPSNPRQILAVTNGHDIDHILYFGDEQIIESTIPDTNGKYDILSYDLHKGAATSILSGDNNTYVFGVIWK